MPGEEIGYFKTALALDPEDFSAQYNLGVAMLGDPDVGRDAWEPLQEALKLEKKINLDDYLVREQLFSPVLINDETAADRVSSCGDQAGACTRL